MHVNFTIYCIQPFSRLSVPIASLFVPKTIRSRERIDLVWSIRSWDDSFHGRFVPGTIRTVDDSFRKNKVLVNCKYG